ncbi:MAG: DUF692 family protein [Candidatus Omnitrophota bacterium]|nr:DUF692 family protein [Candidatus Omnitrophota bacterium]
MVKLAIPISQFFNDPQFIRAVDGHDFCYEGREEASHIKGLKEFLLHFDRDIIHPWLEEDKKAISSVFLFKKDLKLVTFHMSSSYSRPKLKDNVYYPGGEEFSQQQMLDYAKKNICWLKKVTAGRDIDIAVENNNYYSTLAYRHITDADFINGLVKDNGIYFLFDISHAKVTAFNKKISYQKYKTELPMDRMIQVHVSREAFNGKGWAYDAHELPDAQMFDEVKEFTQAYPSLRYITIEYYKNRENLIQILGQYGQLCTK